MGKARIRTAGPCVVGGLLMLMAGCSNGPSEQRATIAKVTRLGDTYQAVALIDFAVYVRLTGCPRGGECYLVGAIGGA